MLTGEQIQEFNPHNKKPEYYHAFLGQFLYDTWRINCGLTKLHSKLIIIMSYYNHFKMNDCKYWSILTRRFKIGVGELVEMGYVVEIRVPSPKNPARQVISYALTKMGKDLSKDFERYYDIKFVEFKNQKLSDRYRFNDGAYFRRVKKTKAEKIPLGKGPANKKFKGRLMDKYKAVEDGKA